MSYYKYFICFSVFFVGSFAFDKRLLLNDPDVMTELKGLSLEVQILKQKSFQLEHDLAQKSADVTLKMKQELATTTQDLANNKLDLTKNKLKLAKIKQSKITSNSGIKFELKNFLSFRVN
ncbi:Hypothetical predicted protein [Mytilus galloprovincialis]|uniref:Uncharacterized protein n=1 Tax=Mytilus galloprovincialis TaxID=29158 RepID=A0A8B6DDL9_MYTGA|nr:Hypothetical predicted protein [Mytilus galloprovincialis]